jgi:A/G-specific adenine glycosylase
MELGAIVCTPSAPKCSECPLVRDCEAHRRGLAETLPRKSDRPRIEEVREVAVVIRKRGEVLLVQRPATGRWAEMWEFPRAEVAAGQPTNEAATSLLESLGIRAKLGESILAIRHGVTRFRITLECLAAEYVSGRFRAGTYPNGIWMRPERVSEFPVSTPQRKLAATLFEQTAGESHSSPPAAATANLRGLRQRGERGRR